MDRKLSIRFYKDREVRAVWDGEHNKWWFSVLDIIGVLNEQDDYSWFQQKVLFLHPIKEICNDEKKDNL